MIIVPNSREYELISHHTFEVDAKKPLTETYLDTIKNSICQTLGGTWIDLKLLDDVTVRVNIETTDNTDNMSAIIAGMIQKGTIHL